MMIKKLVYYCMALLAVFSYMAHSEVILELNDDIDLHVVNMSKPVIKGDVFSSLKTIELPNGINQIAFQYVPHFSSKDTVEKAYSNIIIVKFDISDTTIRFELPHFNSLIQAQREIDRFDWSIVSISGDYVAKIEDQLNITGLVIGRNYVEDVLAYNKTGGPAAVSLVYVTVKNDANLNGNQVITEDASESTVIAEMRLLYQRASLQERKVFQKWMIDQE